MSFVKRLLQATTAALFIAAVLAACTAQDAPTPPRAPLSLSPIPMPTRAPTPTALPAAFWLEEVRLLALLQKHDDLDAAEAAWEEARRLAPADAAIQREGARLALRRGALDSAAERANAAVRLAPQDAEAWLLAGVIAQRLGDLETAQNALQMAESLEPALAGELFPTRWHLALQMSDNEALVMLAQSYLIIHPQDPLAAYYRAETLLASGHARPALELLILRMDTESPGILWYTLGRVYLALNEPTHAISCLETASAALSRGDSSLFLTSSDPTRDVSAALGRAYLAVRRCDDARRLLQVLATPYPDIAALVEEAQRCPLPAPTPTFAPWLP